MVKTNVLEEIGKKLLFIAPHPDDDAIGCGALLLELSKAFRSGRLDPQVDLIHSIHIAFAVSGFNGVSDRFLRANGFDFSDEVEKREIKSRIRREEAIACCDYLGAKPVFWDLPFYEKQEKKFTQDDLDIVSSFLEQIEPDSIFLIDEVSDPHGTHGVVRDVVLKVLQKKSYSGVLFGYQVWEDVTSIDNCDKLVCFDQATMKEKEKLISFYKSQLQDPAYPCEHKDFIELARINNSAMAKKFCTEYQYAECYKKFPKEI
jgi:LmbE family N-acetylglucosaminyl deacetylase